jgi:hypothetical protein
MVEISSFTKAYNSFSGVDINATIGTKTIVGIQGISYTVQREKAPIYVMGKKDPVSFARGKRAIAGSLVFIQFDGEPILKALAGLKTLVGIDELRPEYRSNEIIPVAGTTVGPVGGAASINGPGNTTDFQQTNIVSASSDRMAANPWYADQMPPFDIVLTAANEYGYLAIMKILGCELLNQGNGISVDDIVSEHSYTFVASGLIPWTAQGIHPDMQDQLSQ